MLNDSDFIKVFNVENNRLFGRRQYILGPAFIKELRNWNFLEICDDLFLTYHPDLEVEYIETGSCKYFLIGIILDPFHPELNNAEVLRNLSKSRSYEEFLKKTEDLGGRWILIYHDAELTNIFHDAAGNRQIFYLCIDGKTWCASQPHFIAKYLQINRSQDKEVLDFMNSAAYEKSEHAWIGDGTFYDGIYHLLPNHYLDLKACKAIRYWPHKNFRIENIPMEQAVELSSRMLEGMIKSVSLRYPIILAVTGGWDSRILLAASRNLKDEIYYFIQEFSYNKGKNDNDIKVSQRLLKKLNLELHIEKCEKKIEDKEFDRFFYENVAIIQTEMKKVLHYNFYEKFQGKIYISGNVSGVVKKKYGINRKDITVERMAQYFGRPDDKYTLRKIKEWLLDISGPAQRSNVNILNLFYWEQRMGNWGAMFAADLDVATEVIYPFNCRTLLTTLLSVDEKYRLSYSILYKEMIKSMWKEALSVPINPVSLNSKIRNGIRKIIKMILLRL